MFCWVTLLFSGHNYFLTFTYLMPISRMSPYSFHVSFHDKFDISVQKRKFHTFFMAPHLRYKINHLKKIAWRSNILQQPFLKVVRFVLSHALQGINLENLQPPQRNLFSQHSDFADMELSSATSPCGWVGSPSLGRKESHLPCLKADRRVSVPCHMPDSLQDWEFQGKASAERTFILVWQEKQ